MTHLRIYWPERKYIPLQVIERPLSLRQKILKEFRALPIRWQITYGILTAGSILMFYRWYFDQ